LDFVHEAVRDRYCQDNGRPSIDPEVIIRLFLIQAMDGISHVRELMRQVQVNLAYRWFIGYELDETLPDHSTLSKALDRFGDAVFNELFSRSVSQCQASGLIDGKVLHVDATTIRADIDANKVNQAGSCDPDARFGRFPGGRIKPGYKQHTVADGKKRVVVGVSVTPANCPDDSTMTAMVDDAIDRLEQVPRAVCADAALIELRADSKTESFKKLYRSRAPVIEGIFGEAKQWHGLRRAWRRGLHKMQVQCWLVAAVLNFKRLAARFRLLWPSATAIRYLWGALRRLLGDYLPAIATHRELATH